MGINLTPIVVKRISGLEDFTGRSFAVDASTYLYQFLALIRMPDGKPLTDSEGNVTSHLVGLIFRTTRLMLDYKMRLAFVFDGRPPELKMVEIERRRKTKKKASEEWKKALTEGDYATAFSKAVMTSRMTKSMVDDAKRLLQLLGIPYVQAPSEAEAQAAFMAASGDVWATTSKDYDSLLFGTPRLVRFLTLTGKEYLPSKRVSRPLEPELIILQRFLGKHGITREQLIDLAILVGTDFNLGIKGIGPKTALKLVKTHGKLEDMPSDIKAKLSANYQTIRQLYLAPNIVENYEIGYGELQEEEIYSFLCEERNFSPTRVQTAVKRMKQYYSWTKQNDLGKWLN
ncbi:flap endonuclease-1 [Candidatus Bathyarchaeota archaeon]|nr:flap endonuclease-1 [Candidatus Bathyarchaeota archaeon]